MFQMTKAPANTGAFAVSPASDSVVVIAVVVVAIVVVIMVIVVIAVMMIAMVVIACVMVMMVAMVARVVVIAIVVIAMIVAAHVMIVVFTRNPLVIAMIVVAHVVIVMIAVMVIPVMVMVIAHVVIMVIAAMVIPIMVMVIVMAPPAVVIVVEAVAAVIFEAKRRTIGIVAAPPMRMAAAPFIAVPAAMDPIPVIAIHAPVIDGSLIPVAVVIHRPVVHGVIPIVVRATPTIAVTTRIVRKANAGHAKRETESGRACRHGSKHRGACKGCSRDTNLQQSFHMSSPLIRSRSLRAASEPQMNRPDIYAAE